MVVGEEPFELGPVGISRTEALLATDPLPRPQLLQQFLEWAAGNFVRGHGCDRVVQMTDEAPGHVVPIHAVVRIPVIAVLGNHDYESGQQEEVSRILTDAGVKVLDGEAYEIDGVGIAGAKGFSGGFGRGTVEGEPLEILPYLGTSRLEEPLNRHG